MDGYLNENRWVDLSELPRLKHGENGIIDWHKSVGYTLRFQYDSIIGQIHIVSARMAKNSCNKRQSLISITIDRYIEQPIEIHPSTLRYCKLNHLVKNKIIDICPHMVKYLYNRDDAYKYSYKSGKYISTKCPICGYKDKKQIYALCSRGFSCPICSDGVSAPNKLMRIVLQQCNINFIPEAKKQNGFDWIPNRYRYDFYFKSDNGDNVLIEMDGEFHKKKEQQKVDRVKTNLALKNGFKLIRIDCMYPSNAPFEYMKNNILSSELKNIIPLEIVNWEYCQSELKTSLLVETCRLWENDKLAITEIETLLNISRVSVARYLKYGKQIGICPSYNKQEAFKRRSLCKHKPILITDKYGSTHIFSSTDDAVNQFQNIFNMEASKSGLRTACREYGKYKGLIVQYITKEEYKQYKMINQDKSLEEVAL